MATQKSTQFKRPSQKKRILEMVGVLLVCLVLVTSALLFLKGGRESTQEPTVRATPAVMPTLPAPATSTSQIDTEESENQNFGMSLGTSLFGLTSESLNKRLDTLASLHVGWIRIDFDWSAIQPNNAKEYQWSNYDKVITAARARDIQVLGLLAYTPAWARLQGCDSSRCPPDNLSTFAEFVSVATKRYAPKGVNTWEIWNEPNHAFFWESGANPASYAKLLEVAYSSIKKIDPEAIVVTGGLAPIATGDGNMAPLEFLQEVYANGGGNSFDAVGFHPYSFPATPTYKASWNAWQQMAATSPSLRSIMIAHGDISKKIWLTEYGAPTGGPGLTSNGYIPGIHTDHVTEQLQAQILTEAAKTVKKYTWAGPLFWYTYKDRGASEDTTENFYGLLRFDGSQKPGLEALQKTLSDY